MTEWLVKAAGAVLLLASAGGFGFSSIRAERYRRRELEAFLSLVRHIRENIEHLSRPLPEIYARFDDPLLAASGFLPVLRTEGFAEALERADLRLGEGERAVLGEFASSLGRGYREEQTALCRYAEGKLGEAAEALGKTAPDRERLWRSIPLLAALSLILLLL